MELQTKIEIRRLCGISHASRVMMLGSCFTEKISERLDYFEFQTLVNPSGITYNPVSIAATLQRLIEKKGYCKEDIGCRDGLYYSPDHHGCFSSASVEETIAKIGKSFETAATFLEKTTHIVITLGSSIVYERNGKIWNNCHKLPAKEFSTRMLSIEEITDAFNPIIERLGNVQFVFTISPVRYMNNREYSNSTNKATLLLAVDNLVRQHTNVLYFPAYEIMMDELRDYRFYADDMIHPSPLAVKIIFNRFAEAFFDKGTTRINQMVEQVKTMRNHRPLHPESAEYDKFKQKLYENEEILKRALAECRSNGSICTEKR